MPDVVLLLVWKWVLKGAQAHQQVYHSDALPAAPRDESSKRPQLEIICWVHAQGYRFMGPRLLDVMWNSDWHTAL